MRLLVTGSSGLLGSEVAEYFLQQGAEVHGIDNNQRARFFGPSGDTQWRRESLGRKYRNQFVHHDLDVRDRSGIQTLLPQVEADAIVHAAGQPSHDLAATIPFADFETNAVGTLNLLEATRLYRSETPFIFLSTNKVYGDGPNTVQLKELETRWDFADERFINGIDESFPIDASMHSLFGASKLSADILVQEYGRYFEMPTCCFRAGCLTGPNHAGVELHGFLSYLVKCVLSGTTYRIYGYKGKQVRDNLHAHDVARLIEFVIQKPGVAAVYNIGGGKPNSCSIVEAFEHVGRICGIEPHWDYVDQARRGDHICYYSDLSRVQADYPDWRVERSLETIISEIVAAWAERITQENSRR